MSPVGRRFDFQIAGKGFLLQRGDYAGRAWNRSGRSDTPGQRSQTDAEYGALPDELDHPEVWNDWSGGFGHAYRETGENTYHWGENFDARFPRQLVHCQQMNLAYWRANGVFTLAEPIHISDSPLVQNPSTMDSMVGTLGQGSVLIQSTGYNASAGAHIPYIQLLQPTGVAGTTNSSFANIRPYGTGGVSPGPAYGRSAVFGSFQYVGAASGNFWQVPLATASTSAQSTMPGMGFAVAGNILWRYHGAPSQPYYLQNCAVIGGASLGLDGPMITGNWSATLTIGNGRSRILDMVSLDGQLVIGMSDGLYIGDTSATFVNVLEELGDYSQEDNCRDLAVHNGAVIFPHLGGIYSYHSSGYQSIIEHIWPQERSSRSPITGVPRAVKPFAGYLYAGIWSGSASYLIAGNNDTGKWTWHTLNRFPYAGRVNRLHFDSITTGTNLGIVIPTRFWAATDPTLYSDVESGLYYQPIPRFNGNPLAPDTVFSPAYVASARIDLGAVDWDAPGTPKVFRSVEVWADSLLSGYRYGDIYYDVDQSGSFTLLGRANTSPKTTMYFPTGEGSFVTGQSIELRLASTTLSPALTPVYRAVVLRGALQPRSVDMITAVVRIADRLRDRQGGEMRSSAAMLQELRDFGNPDANGTQAHQLIDLAGATQWVKVLGRVEEREVYQEGDDNPEIAATVRMAVLTYS